ncbi:MAG: hypothetical protein Q9180_003926 [Flavoplaca navasiana]
MKVSEDHSLFAWKTSEEARKYTTCGLLANSPADFADSSNVIPILPEDEGQEVDVAGSVGKNHHQAVYVAQQEDIWRRKVQRQFSFHIAELPEELSKEGAIMTVVPNFKNLSVHWASEERRLDLSSGLGAAIYIGRDGGYGTVYLIGITSECRIRCVLHKENVASITHHVDIALNQPRAAFEWSEWEASFLHGHYNTGLYENLRTSLDLGQWVAHQKDHPKFYQRKYQKIWIPRDLKVHMAIDRTSLEGQGIYEVQFHNRWN